MALEGENCDVSSLLDNYSDLLCIGTVGDIVELKSENRVFVKRGLVNIQESDRAGPVPTPSILTVRSVDASMVA